ncbi:hypothetical protein [Fundidesulfovibrio agrisoli]|uniref:hypothetical protein n=1 Tax=Fundidesulfovibrio agrisoli TaxID=2922717 RepID=UPI001FADC1E2|nr:hypothetical protein [Fundidesulfovibrio agrisoli]
MRGESMPGAGGVGARWAVWPEAVKPREAEAPAARMQQPFAREPRRQEPCATETPIQESPVLEPPVEEQAAPDIQMPDARALTHEAQAAPALEGPNLELAELKVRSEALARENELLRQRLALADRQVEVKDMQINDFKAITENLTRQNQVLLMLAQGVPMERILKGGQDIEVRPRDHAGQEPSRQTPRSGPSKSSKPGNDRRQAAAPVKADRSRLASILRGMVKKGMSHRLIAEALNRDGAPTLSGTGAWDRRKVGKAVALLLA